MKYKLLLIIILISFYSSITLESFAQLVDYGQNPPGLHWRQIKTPHVQLIFPEKFRTEAWRMAGVLEKMYFFQNRSLKVNTHPISIVLQNQQVESNAFVLLAPRRSEFYTTPAQDMEPTDWLNSLAVHEMRHVVQEDKVFGGTRLQLFESIQVGIFGLVFPSWFFEGDAVGMETSLTETGRGRLPSFEREMRANLLSGKNFSYSKNYLGSLNDNVPDYYRLGYFMVTKMRRDFGDSMFNVIYKDAIKLKPWPLSRALKKHTGYTTSQFYERTMAEIKEAWTLQLNSKKPESYPLLNQRKNPLYSNAYLPRPCGKNQLIFLKTGLDKISAFYSLNLLTGEERKIKNIGEQLVANFDLAGDLLVWDEERYDPRYAYRTYSVLMSYNMKTKALKRLSYRSRLLGASLSADATKVITLHVDYTNHYFLRILNANNGTQLAELPNPENYYFENPRFDSTAKRIIAVAVNNRGKALYEYRLDSGSHRLVSSFSFTDISRPVYADSSHILYNSATSGIDDIYLHELRTGAEHQITNSRFGAYNPFVQGDRVYFNLFQCQGMDISFISLHNQLAKKLNTPSHFINYFKPLVKREAGGSVFSEQRKMYDSLTNRHDKNMLDSLAQARFSPDSVQNRFISESDTLLNKQMFKESPYHELSHLFYFHSLLPSVQQFDLNSTNFLAGLKLTSTNKLNTAQTYLGVYYQNGYNSFQYQAGITYQKFYPVFNVNFVDGKFFSLAQAAKTAGNSLIPFSYREMRFNMGLQLPLVFLSRTENWSAGAEISTAYVHKYAPSLPVQWTPNLPFPIHYRLYVSKNSFKAARDLYPRWGQNISLDFESLPFYHAAGSAPSHNGTLFYVNSHFYAPGLFSHHSFQAGYSFQQSDGLYAYNRSINEINGSTFLPPNRLKNTLLINYFLPLAYPDWQLSSLAYIRKIQAGAFLNYQNLGGGRNPLLKTYSSYGLDFRVECNLLRYYLPIFQLGTRIIFFDKEGVASPKFSLVLNYTI